MLANDIDELSRSKPKKPLWPLWAGAVSLALHGGAIAWLSHQAEQAPSTLSLDVVEMQIITLAPPAGEISQPLPPPEPEPTPEPEPEPAVVPEPVAKPDEMAIKRKPKEEPKKEVKPKPKPVPKPKPEPVKEKPKTEPRPPAPAVKVESNVKATSSAPAQANKPSNLPPAPEQQTAAQYNSKYLRNPPPSYPDMSRRMKEEGTVLLQVVVTAEGRAGDVKLAKSSGSERLDQAAIKAVKRWRFVPAKRGDQAIQSTVNVPVQFSLKNAR